MASVSWSFTGRGSCWIRAGSDGAARACRATMRVPESARRRATLPAGPMRSRTGPGTESLLPLPRSDALLSGRRDAGVGVPPHRGHRDLALRRPPRHRHLPGRWRPEGLRRRSSQVYASPPGRIGEVLLGAALLYHALNGLRIVIMDFWPRMTRYHRQLWYGALGHLRGPRHARPRSSSSSPIFGLPDEAPSMARTRGLSRPRPAGRRLRAGRVVPRAPLGPRRCSCWPWRTSASCTSCSTRRRRRRSWIFDQRWNELCWRALDWLAADDWSSCTLPGRADGRRRLHPRRRPDGRCPALYLLALVLFVLGTIVVVTLPRSRL